MTVYTPYVPPETNASLSTPAPVYAPADFKGMQRPEVMPSGHKLRAMNAAVRARKAFPGPAGDVLASDLMAYAEMGYIAHQAAPIARLVEQLLDEPLPPAA